MERLFQWVIILVCAYTVHSVYPVQQENIYYVGGEFAYKGIPAEHCVRYCRKLGTCWGVDYFRFGGRCAVHMDGDSCEITARREFKGVDHFRVKACEGEEYFPSQYKKPTPPPKDEGLAELRRRLDAKKFTANCYMNIYENSYVKSARGIKGGDKIQSSGFLIKTNLSVSQCAELCWAQPNCKAFNFVKDGGKCYVFSKIFNVNQLTSDKCCHHVMVSCFTDTQTRSTTSVWLGFSRSPGPHTTPSATPASSGRFRHVTTTPAVTMASSTPTSPVHSSLPDRSTTTVPVVLSTERPPPLPIKLPDLDKIVNKVCPFLVLPGTSRPGGKYVGQFVETMEVCQEFCEAMNADSLKCYAVDWNAQTTDCFYFDTEDTSDVLNYTDTYIYHFQYNPCDSLQELECIVHPPMNISSESVIVGPLNDIDHSIQPCDTFCFFKYSFERTVIPGLGGAPDMMTSQHMLERGCGDDVGNYLGWRQCASPAPPSTTSIAIMCHCIGNVCNSVGVSAFANLYAYYPFDYGMEDLSGYNRHGEGRGTLKYTNLDVRSTGAAAVFDGSASVSIPGLTLVHLSEVQSLGDLRVSSAFSMWVRRLYGQAGNMTIMSNAKKRGYSTIGIYSDVDPTDKKMHIITVSVRLMGETFSVKSQPMESGTWQFVCMNIRDSQYPPVMALYIGEMGGLPPTEVSSIALLPTSTAQQTAQKYLDLTSHRLTIGKQNGPGNKYPFMGELDELHFYQGELSEDDIWALMVQSYY